MGKLYWTGAFGYLDNATGDGILSSRIRQDIDAASASGVLDVDLMSPGGNFWEIAPIMGFIRGFRGKTKLTMAGLVGSAASAIAMAFEERVSNDLSIFYIHNAQGGVFGDHNDMEEGASQYKDLSEMMAREYSRASGLPISKVKSLMDGEKGNGTWIMGKKIHELGFSTRHESSEASNDFNTSMLLVSAQAQFQSAVTMWAKDPPKADKKAEIELLIESGAVDRVSKWDPKDDDETDGLSNEYQVTMNGRVYRSGLRKVAALAAKKADRETEAWATSMLAKIDKGETRVNKETVFAWLKDNPGIPLSEIAAVMGQSGALMSADARVAVEMKAKLDAAQVADPLATIATMKAELDKVAADKFKVAMFENFGPEKYETGQENLLRQYAETKLSGVNLAELSAKLEEFKKDPLALKLAGERMDANADVNLFGKSEKGSAPGSAGNGGFERHLKL